MDVKTARKYLRARHLPSEMKAERHWRTRQDGFAEVWPEIQEQLRTNPGLEAKTIFAALQRQYPERFANGQLQTLQRRIKHWRATEGPAHEVYFVQEHRAGELCESDFTYLTELAITIGVQPFPHMLYHFVLTYSNWETGTICPSESFASLSEGLQNALWELGGVPRLHRTDRMTAAVNNLTEQVGLKRPKYDRNTPMHITAWALPIRSNGGSRMPSRRVWRRFALNQITRTPTSVWLMPTTC